MSGPPSSPSPGNLHRGQRGLPPPSRFAPPPLLPTPHCPLCARRKLPACSPFAYVTPRPTQHLPVNRACGGAPCPSFALPCRAHPTHAPEGQRMLYVGRRCSALAAGVCAGRGLVAGAWLARAAVPHSALQTRTHVEKSGPSLPGHAPATTPIYWRGPAGPQLQRRCAQPTRPQLTYPPAQQNTQPCPPWQHIPPNRRSNPSCLAPRLPCKGPPTPL